MPCISTYHGSNSSARMRAASGCATTVVPLRHRALATSSRSGRNHCKSGVAERRISAQCSWYRALTPLVALLSPVTGFGDASSFDASAEATRTYEEPWNTGWSVGFDNDLLAQSDGDRDYTAGFSVTLHGRRAQSSPLDGLVTRLNGLVPLDAFSESMRAGSRFHALQFGLALFTPDDVSLDTPIPDDRPYASLVYLSNTRLALHRNRRTAYQSSVAVGLLGSSVGEWAHKSVHKAYGGTEPNGYRHQISNGGELTGRYSIARHSLLASRERHGSSVDLKLSLQGSVGYLTEADVALRLRWGRIRTAWWSGTADSAAYADQPAIAPLPHRSIDDREHYLWASAGLRGIGYNALLQGQFRQSAVTFSSADLNRILARFTVGATTQLSGLRITYALHYQSSEIKSGPGARSTLWGGITISKYFRS